jgi:hypothetical protein
MGDAFRSSSGVWFCVNDGVARLLKNVIHKFGKFSTYVNSLMQSKAYKQIPHPIIVL